MSSLSCSSSEQSEQKVVYPNSLIAFTEGIKGDLVQLFGTNSLINDTLDSNGTFHNTQQTNAFVPLKDPEYPETFKVR